jgi:hypothetical protein
MERNVAGEDMMFVGECNTAHNKVYRKLAFLVTVRSDGRWVRFVSQWNCQSVAVLYV